MIAVFEEHLKRMTVKHAEPFHAELRKRVGKKATAVIEKRLKHLIMIMPRLLSEAYERCRREEVPHEIRRLVGYALTYFYHPMDILPEGEDELFGYLDDAYFVGLVYEKLLEADSDLKESGLSSFDRDFLKMFPKLKRNLKSVIPEESEEVRRIFEKLLGRERGFFKRVWI